MCVMNTKTSYSRSTETTFDEIIRSRNISPNIMYDAEFKQVMRGIAEKNGNLVRDLSKSLTKRIIQKINANTR